MTSDLEKGDAGLPYDFYGAEVVAAGVTKNVPDTAVVGGDPSKVIKEIPNDL